MPGPRAICSSRELDSDEEGELPLSQWWKYNASKSQLDLQKKLQATAAKHGSLTQEEFRLEMVKLAVEAGLTPDPQVSRSCRRHNFAPDRILTSILLTLILMQSVTMTGTMQAVVKHPGNKPGIFGVRLNAQTIVATTLAQFPPYWQKIPSNFLAEQNLRPVRAPMICKSWPKYLAKLNTS